MKIGYLGVGAWGYALAKVLASKGHNVISWTIFPDLAEKLNKGAKHPMLPCSKLPGKILVTTNLREALENADLIVESVTGAGIRPVFEQVKAYAVPKCPIVVTSKGIEQNTGLTLPQVIAESIGQKHINQIGSLSGPSYATEVIQSLPTSVVVSAYDSKVINLICDSFSSDFFRVYPNKDMVGVSFGGALKNIIAIACGIAEGLNLGMSARASLMTRGLHEISKLARAYGAKSETLYGLSGMGDLFVTCSSITSRNFQFGYLLAKGKSPKEAKKEIGMVVEGAYSAVSALQLSQKKDIEMPICEIVNKIIFEALSPKKAVAILMSREVKEEHL